MIYGSMEHVLWDRITTGRVPDLDRSAEQLTTLLHDAFLRRQASPEALARFHADVLQAVRQVEASARVDERPDQA